MSRFTAVTAAILAAAIAVAPATASADTANDDIAEKSPGTALAVSLGVTAAGYASIYLMNENDYGSPGLGYLTAAAITLGPSVGHWYSGDYITAGLGLRLGGGLAGIAGLAMMFEECPLFAARCEDSPGGAILVATGATAFVVGSVYDIATASRAARKHNERARRTLSVAPQISRDNVGMVVAGTF